MTEQDPFDGPVARHLARTLAEVAAATPVGDRRNAIAARLPHAGDEEPHAGAGPRGGVGPAGPQPRRDRRRAVMAVAVAAVALVVVALAAVAIRRGDDGTVDVRPVEEPDLDTGWYLPDGWTVTAATAEPREEGTGICPCTTLVASETGDDPAALVVREAAASGFAADEAADAIDVGGRPGTVRPPDVEDLPAPLELDERSELVVETGGRLLLAVSRGLDHQVVADVVDAWADRIEAGEPVRRADLPLPDGMEAAAPRTTSATFATEVLVTATDEPSGATLHYELAPAGGRTTLEAVLDGDRTTFDGEEFIVESRAGPDDLLSVTRTGGPVDVVAGVRLLGEPVRGEDLTTAFATALHEVSTDEWREALEQVRPEVDRALLAAPTLLDPPLTG